jgi:aminoglycoside phosphotransferase (APT) family kinase protein
MSPSLEDGAAAVAAWLEARGMPPGAGSGRLLEPPNGERLVAEYEIGQASVIGKGYRDDTGARTFAVMRSLRAALGGAQAGPLTIPEPLWYDAPRRCLLQEKVSGAPLADLARGEDCARALALAGEALAALHALALPQEAPKRLQDHLRELIRPHPLALAEAVPAWRARIEALLGALGRSEASFAGCVQPAALHRDFHLRQMFLTEGRIALIDWDLFAFGDPALDVGNFLMYLRTGLKARAQAASDAFLEGYLRRGEAGVAQRAPTYTALNYLRRACKHYRLAEAGWRERSAAMLAAAEASLESTCLGAEAS